MLFRSVRWRNAWTRGAQVIICAATRGKSPFAGRASHTSCFIRERKAEVRSEQRAGGTRCEKRGGDGSKGTAQIRTRTQDAEQCSRGRLPPPALPFEPLSHPTAGCTEKLIVVSRDLSLLLEAISTGVSSNGRTSEAPTLCRRGRENSAHAP